jgi:hypothetical protein
MESHSETMRVENDAAGIGPAQVPSRERRPRFRLIKLEERIAPGGGGGTARPLDSSIPISPKTICAPEGTTTCPI